MIFKNGEKHVIEQADFTKFKKQYKFPVVLKYVEDRKTKINGRIFQPRSVPIRLVWVNGSDEWRYAKSVTPKKEGNVLVNKYSPDNVSSNNGRIVINEKEAELLWFLVKCYPFLRGGEAADRFAGRHYYIIEDQENEAAKRNAAKEASATVDFLLFNPTMKVKEKMLREIAKAMYLDGTDLMGEEQLRDAVGNMVRANEKNMKLFLDLESKNLVVDGRAFIQTAIDNDIVVKNSKNTWHWRATGQGTKLFGNKICESPSPNPKDDLFGYADRHPEFVEALKARLKEVELIKEEV